MVKGCSVYRAAQGVFLIIDSHGGPYRERGGGEPTPGYQGEGELVDTSITYPPCCPAFGKKFRDQSGIFRGDSFCAHIPVNNGICIAFLDTGKMIL